MQVTLHASDVGASGRFSGRFADHTARFTRIAVTFLSAPLTAAMQISTLLHNIIDCMQVLLNKRAHAETKSRLVLTELPMLFRPLPVPFA
jgi:hypothetical protein